MFMAGAQHQDARTLHVSQGGAGLPGHGNAVASGSSGAEGVVASKLRVQEE